METSTTCYVCHADKTIAFNRYLSFFQYLHKWFSFMNILPITQFLFLILAHIRFPSGLGHLPDQVWRIKWLTALKFSPEIIDKPPTQIERGWIICERHFADSCFIDGKLLIHGSVPELYLDEMRSNEVLFYFPFKNKFKFDFRNILNVSDWSDHSFRRWQQTG